MAFRGDLDALILGTLTVGQMHGYEISKRINAAGAADSDEEPSVRVQEGQLYPLLHRLENEGLIEANWLPQEGKPARKVYRLTDAGRGALEAKRASWRQFARSMSQLLGVEPEGQHG